LFFKRCDRIDDGHVDGPLLGKVFETVLSRIRD